MARQEIGGVMDDNNLNKVNYNFIELYQIHQRMTAILNDLILESGGDSNLEVVQARGGKRVLNDRLNEFDEQLAETDQQKADKSEVNYHIDHLENNKADKSYVDVLFENLGQLEVKGSYDSVSDLTNAYPNGTTGLFEVDGSLYAWSGNEWVKIYDLEVMPWADFLTTQDEEWII